MQSYVLQNKKGEYIVEEEKSMEVVVEDAVVVIWAVEDGVVVILVVEVVVEVILGVVEVEEEAGNCTWDFVLIWRHSCAGMMIGSMIARAWS